MKVCQRVSHMTLSKTTGFVFLFVVVLFVCMLFVVVGSFFRGGGALHIGLRIVDVD